MRIQNRPGKRISGFFGRCVLIFLLPVAAASAQTAEKLDEVLAAGQVSFAQAAGIILPAAGLLEPEAGPDEAFAQARDWFPRRAERDTPIKLGELSFLVMRSFSLSGGFMYALFPSPRYAYRALAWRRFLPPNADPAQLVSGEELLYITGRVLADAEERQAGFEAGTEVKPGMGLSSGTEGIHLYQGEFQID
ncbi:MAG: hypothetical protein LBK27_01045 [Treponema sp.]|jgi:hypothetical protein|nr:hypothetical protein [Treponema sp.]